MVLHQTVHPSDNSFDLAFLWKLTGSTDQSRLRAAIDHVIGEMTAFRTSYSTAAGELTAMVNPERPRTEILEIPPDLSDTQAERWIQASLRNDIDDGPFDLGDGGAKAIIREADIVVVSLLRPRYLDKTWFKEGAIVLDFAPNVIGLKTLSDGRSVPDLCGGVDVDSVTPAVSKIFPIPSGIGPVMLGALARNLAQSAVHRQRASADHEVTEVTEVTMRANN